MTHCSNNPKCRCQNCFLCCYTAIRKYRMYCKSYPFLYQAYKVILTLSVTQVACERTFNKLKYVKNRLRSQLSEDRLDSLLFMRVERDILTRVLNVIVSDDFNRVQTERPHQASLKCIKKWPSTQKINIFLHIITRTSMACEKEKKVVVTCACGNVKVQTFFKDHTVLR